MLLLGDCMYLEVLLYYGFSKLSKQSGLTLVSSLSLSLSLCVCVTHTHTIEIRTGNN